MAQGPGEFGRERRRVRLVQRAKLTRTPGGAAMRNRCPGATAQPAAVSAEATPSSSGTGTQQVNPDRPLAVIP